MTSLTLLLWIISAIALQLAVYLVIALWRRGRAYAALKTVEQDTVPDVHTHAWTGLRRFRVARKVIEDAAETVCSFYLVPEDGQPLPPYRAGQHLALSLDIPAASAKRTVRCYTLSDAPQRDAYRISVKRVPGGVASGFLHDCIKPGDILEARAPAGHFHIGEGEMPVVLIGGGIGITPALSMLNWSLAHQPSREVWLFYGVRNAAEAIMLPRLRQLAAEHANFHLRLCFSAPRREDLNGDADVIHGRVDIALLREQLPLMPFEFYICGPAAMLESVVPALEAWGVQPWRIHFEAFGPSSLKRRRPAEGVQAGETAVTVTFARSRKQISWRAGEGSLLEFAEANGVSVASGCRAGGCGSCQTAINAGEITYQQPPGYDPEPGTCLLCVCAPKTSITLEA